MGNEWERGGGGLEREQRESGEGSTGRRPLPDNSGKKTIDVEPNALIRKERRGGVL